MRPKGYDRYVKIVSWQDLLYRVGSKIVKIEKIYRLQIKQTAFYFTKSQLSTQDAVWIIFWFGISTSLCGLWWVHFSWTCFWKSCVKQWTQPKTALTTMSAAVTWEANTLIKIDKMELKCIDFGRSWFASTCDNQGTENYGELSFCVVAVMIPLQTL